MKAEAEEDDLVGQVLKVEEEVLAEEEDTNN
jgi:hypothetical protein